jgi:Flp pilus assembly protein TadD
MNANNGTRKVLFTEYVVRCKTGFELGRFHTKIAAYALRSHLYGRFYVDRIDTLEDRNPATRDRITVTFPA